MKTSNSNTVENKKEPLYKVLDGQREAGEITYDNHWRNGITLRRNDEKVCEFFGEFDKDAITAQYTALAVNNLASLAEALESVSMFLDKQILATPTGVSRNQMTDINLKAKEALLKIS